MYKVLSLLMMASVVASFLGCGGGSGSASGSQQNTINEPISREITSDEVESFISTGLWSVTEKTTEFGDSPWQGGTEHKTLVSVFTGAQGSVFTACAGLANQVIVDISDPSTFVACDAPSEKYEVRGSDELRATFICPNFSIEAIFSRIAAAPTMDGGSVSFNTSLGEQFIGRNVCGDYLTRDLVTTDVPVGTIYTNAEFIIYANVTTSAGTQTYRLFIDSSGPLSEGTFDLEPQVSNPDAALMPGSDQGPVTLLNVTLRRYLPDGTGFFDDASWFTRGSLTLHQLDSRIMSGEFSFSTDPGESGAAPLTVSGPFEVRF